MNFSNKLLEYKLGYNVYWNLTHKPIYLIKNVRQSLIKSILRKSVFVHFHYKLIYKNYYIKNKQNKFKLLFNTAYDNRNNLREFNLSLLCSSAFINFRLLSTLNMFPLSLRVLNKNKLVTEQIITNDNRTVKTLVEKSHPVIIKSVSKDKLNNNNVILENSLTSKPFCFTLKAGGFNGKDNSGVTLYNDDNRLTPYKLSKSINGDSFWFSRNYRGSKIIDVYVSPVNRLSILSENEHLLYQEYIIELIKSNPDFALWCFQSSDIEEPVIVGNPNNLMVSVLRVLIKNNPDYITKHSNDEIIFESINQSSIDKEIQISKKILALNISSKEFCKNQDGLYLPKKDVIQTELSSKSNAKKVLFNKLFDKYDPKYKTEKVQKDLYNNITSNLGKNESFIKNKIEKYCEHNGLNIKEVKFKYNKDFIATLELTDENNNSETVEINKILKTDKSYTMLDIFRKNSKKLILYTEKDLEEYSKEKSKKQEMWTKLLIKDLPDTDN